MNKKDIKELKSIKSNTTRLLWYSNKHDGIPYEGLMLYKGQKCWYRVYDIDCKEMRYSDSDLIKSGYTDEDIEFMDESDRNWFDELHYFKIYKLSQREIFNLEEEHDKFRDKWGNHTDYDYKAKTKKRNIELNELLDNSLIKWYKKLREFIYKISTKKKGVSDISENYFKNKGTLLYQKNIIGYFKI